VKNNAETVVMNSWSQMVGGLNRLLPKEIRSRHWLISEESRQTGFETSYVTPYSTISGAMHAAFYQKTILVI
jgi:hypothetical protein